MTRALLAEKAMAEQKKSLTQQLTRARKTMMRLVAKFRKPSKSRK